MTPLPGSASALLRQHLERAARRLPGLQYAATTADGVVFELCAGWQELGALPVVPATTFMAASCTKVVTAAATLRLVERALVRLDGSLSDYYADHPYGRGVTIRHLLNQTSGVPSPMPINWLHRVEDATFDEDQALAAVLRAHPRASFPAGTRYAYSNLSYWLLGKVIERASGLRYEDYVTQEIFAPLGATTGELGFVVPGAGLGARGYQRKYSAMGLFVRLAVRGEFLDGTEGAWLRFSRVYMNGPAYGGITTSSRT